MVNVVPLNVHCWKKIWEFLNFEEYGEWVWSESPIHHWYFNNLWLSPLSTSEYSLKILCLLYFFSKCIPHYMVVVVVLYQACQRPWWSPAKQRVLRGALTKNPAKFKFQWILVYGVKWKSYIIELSTKYDFHFTPSTNIHLNLNFRLFFLTVRVEGWGEIFSFEKIIIIILYGFKTLVLKCSEKRPRKKDLSGFLLSW